MSTSKHIDTICIAAAALMLAITVLFMCGGSLGITVAAQSMPYESTLFDTSYVHTVDIVMNDWDSFIETCENEEYASCTVVIDGQKHSNIAIRAKGNTSLSTVSSMNSNRYSFKLEFDHYDSSKSLDGLDKLCLNNLIQDNTMMKDYVVYRMMSEFGVDSPLCSFAYLTVNGEDWGLYLAVEGIEDSFLTRNYGSEVGDLYKPDSISNGGGRGNGMNFNMDDFDFGNTDTSNTESQGNQDNQGTQQWNPQGSQGGQFNPFEQSGGQQGIPGGQGGFNPGGQGGQTDTNGDNTGTWQLPDDFDPSAIGGDVSFDGGMGSDDVKLKYIDDDPDSYANIFDSAKTNVTAADEKRLIQSLKNLSSYTDLENTVDTDEVMRYFVVHNFVCNGDSYTGSMIHNYYLYEEDGVLRMIPWDYNLAYGTFQGGNASDTVNTSIDSPISGGTVDDRPMLGWIFSDETYTEQYHTLFAAFIETWFTNGELTELIEQTAEMIRPYVDKDPTKFCTTEEFDAGVSALSQFVTLRAEAVVNQLNGSTAQVDTGSLNLSDMGTMNSGMGGMDIPDMPDFNANLSSLITLKDADGNTVDVTTVIPTTASIVSVTLSDGTCVSLTNADMNTLMTLDIGQIVAAADSDGNTYDLSAYTISLGMQAGPGGAGENGGTVPAIPGIQGTAGGTIASLPGTQGEADGTMPSDPSGNDGNEIPGGQQGGDAGNAVPGGQQGGDAGNAVPGGQQGGDAGNAVPGGQQNQNGFPGGIDQGQMPDAGNGSGQFGPDAQNGMPDAAGEFTKWILVGVSVLVLAVGLVIAVKKKY